LTFLAKKGSFVHYIQQLIQFVEHAHSKDDNIFYFSNGIQSKNLEQPEFAKARLAITYSILDELKIISK
jgi:hypothetical protein